MIQIEVKDTKKLLKIAIPLFVFSIIFDNVSTYIALSQNSDMIRETNCVVVDYIEKYGLINGLIYSEINMFIGYSMSIFLASIIFAFLLRRISEADTGELIKVYLFYGISLFSLLKVGAGLTNIIFAIYVRLS